MQLALGFLLTVATIWIVPWLRDHGGWWIAFASLAPGPLLGAWALTRLRPGSAAMADTDTSTLTNHGHSTRTVAR